MSTKNSRSPCSALEYVIFLADNLCGGILNTLAILDTVISSTSKTFGSINELFFNSSNVFPESK